MTHVIKETTKEMPVKDDDSPVTCQSCGETYIPVCHCGEGPNGPSHYGEGSHGFVEYQHRCEDPNAVEGLHAMDRAGWL